MSTRLRGQCNCCASSLIRASLAAASTGGVVTLTRSSSPSTNPSTPLAVIASSRRIMSSDATTNRPRKNQSTKGPVLSIHVMNASNPASLARGFGHAKRVPAARVTAGVSGGCRA